MPNIIFSSYFYSCIFLYEVVDWNLTIHAHWCFNSSFKWFLLLFLICFHDDDLYKISKAELLLMHTSTWCFWIQSTAKFTTFICCTNSLSMWVGTLNVKEFVLLARNSVSPLSCPCLSLYVSYHYPAVLMSLNYCLFYSNNSNSWEIQYHKALMLKIYHEEPKMFLKILHNLTILVSHHKKELN